MSIMSPGLPAAVVMLALAVPASVLGPDAVPNRFVKAEALDLGFFIQTEGWGGLNIRLAKASLVFGRVRAGISFIDAYEVIDDWGSDFMLPLHVGFTIWENPKRTWAWCSFVPDVYLEGSGSLWNTGSYAPEPLRFRYEPAVRLAVCCDFDYYGLGIGLDAGWMNVDTETEFYGRMSLFYAGLRLRGLALGFGF